MLAFINMIEAAFNRQEKQNNAGADKAQRCYNFVIPAKARDYVFTGVGSSVCLFVCLFITTITK